MSKPYLIVGDFHERIEAIDLLVNHSQGLLKRLLEFPADGHDFSHALHRASYLQKATKQLQIVISTLFITAPRLSQFITASVRNAHAIIAHLVVDSWELLQIPAGNFNNAIIEARLEAGRGGIGDGVSQLFQGHVE